MKILILVLSFNEPPYKELMQSQWETWDGEIVPNVSTIYYHGGGEELFMKINHRNHSEAKESWIVQFNCTDEYYRMAEKFQKCLSLIEKENIEYDLIFRTNSSSYINLKELLKFAESLPLEKCYAGWTFYDTNDDGGLCVSGAGIWLSRDCAKTLMDEIDPEKEIEEDVYIGRILRKHGIVAIDDKSREDVNFIHSGIPKNKYHYRFKGHNDRLIDAQNMRKIHHLILNK